MKGTRRLTVYVNDETVHAIDALARITGLSRSEIIRQCIARGAPDLKASYRALAELAVDPRRFS